MIGLAANCLCEMINSQASEGCQVELQTSTENCRTGTCQRSHARQSVPRGKKNPLYQQVAQRLVWLREVSGLPQIDLGLMAGVSHTTISSIEITKVTSKISTIEQVATALGVSPAWLAFGEDGHLPWRERHPRFGLEPAAPPEPAPAARECQNLYQGMGARLKLAREVKGLSMRALGRAAGCTVAAISLLEAGTSVVLLSTCEDLAKALDVAPGWLAYGIGQGPVSN